MYHSFAGPRRLHQSCRFLNRLRAELSDVAAGTCKTGTPQESAAGLIPNGPDSNCRIAHDLVMTSLGPLTIDADVMVFDPYYVSAIGHQHSYCAVETGYSDLREDFPI